MNCNKCKTELIWGGDHDCEDYGVGGDGIVSNLSCPNCDTYCCGNTDACVIAII